MNKYIKRKEIYLQQKLFLPFPLPDGGGNLFFVH